MRVSAAACVAWAAIAIAAPVPKEKEKEQPAYHPDKVGAKWVYQAHGLEETYYLTDIAHTESSVTIKIGFVRPSSGKVVPDQTLTVTDKGMFRVESAGKKCDPPVPLLILPHRAGDKLAYREGKSQVNVITLKEELIEVPAGKFRAIPVKTEILHPDGEEVSISWYAQGVGLVKAKSGGDETVLKSFTPGKK